MGGRSPAEQREQGGTHRAHRRAPPFLCRCGPVSPPRPTAPPLAVSPDLPTSPPL